MSSVKGKSNITRGASASIAAALPNIVSSTPLAGALAYIQRNMSVSMQLIGTSSGDEQTEWFGLLGKYLGEQHDYNVIWRVWSDTTKTYSAPVTMVHGSLGDRYLNTKTSSCILRHTSQMAMTATDNLEVIARIEPTKYDNGTMQVLASQYSTVGGDNRSWYLGISQTGALYFKWWTDGVSTSLYSQSTVALTGTTGPLYVKCVHKPDNGASGNDTLFYTSTNGTTWTQLGTTVTKAGTTQRFVTAIPYQLASLDGGINGYFGKLYWVEIHKGIDGPNAVPNLPELYDHTNGENTSLEYGGSPVIDLHNGSKASQVTSYFNTNIVNLMESNAPCVVFVSACHNDSAKTRESWVTLHKSLIDNIKTYAPYVPIVVASQPPMKVAGTKTATSVAMDGMRSAVLGTFAASQTGVYYYDLWQTFTDTTDTILSDGIHPTPKGSALWRDYVLKSLFGSRLGNAKK